MVLKINESLLEPVAVFYVADPSGADRGELLGAGLTGAERLAVPEHWLGQRAPPDSAHTALALLYIALTAAALIGNGLVIFIFITSKSLRTASNMLVVNLAVCDFFMMAKAPLFIYNSVKRGFATGVSGCNAFAFVGAYSGIVAGATNACIAYDRHSAITRPLDGRLSRGKATLMLGLVWLYATPWAVLPLLQIWGRYVPEGYLTSCTFDYLTRTFDTRLFVACITFCSYVMPMSLVLYFYSGIVKRVFAHEAALRAQAKKMQVDSLRANQQSNAQTAEIRIAKAALTVCFMFVASWTPYGVMALIGAFGDQALLTPGVTMIPAVACKVVACVDPWIYAISHPKYRQELQRRLPWLQIDEPADDTPSTCTAATNAPAPTT